MSGERATVRRSHSVRRVWRKLVLRVSMGSLVPAAIRVRLLSSIGVNFVDRTSAFIGDGVYFDNIDPSLVTLGQWCRVTSGTKFLTHFFDTKHVPSADRPFNFYAGKIVVGDYVFIGAGTVFSKPVTIGDWAIIGANTVVTKDVPKGAIFLGNPGRIIGYRPGFEPSTETT